MELLSEIKGKKVTVHSLQGETERQDVGVLEDVQGQWLKLRKSNSEVLFFCIYHLRLIKPFDPL
jgi:ferredoxin-fold anticodon binding domain-containing protein